MTNSRTVAWHLYTYREISIDAEAFKDEVIDLLQKEQPKGWMNWYIVFGQFEADQGVVFVKAEETKNVAVDVNVKQAGSGGGLKLEFGRTAGLTQAYKANPGAKISPIIMLFPVSTPITATSTKEEEVDWTDLDLPLDPNEETFLEPVIDAKEKDTSANAETH